MIGRMSDRLSDHVRSTRTGPDGQAPLLRGLSGVRCRDLESEETTSDSCGWMFEESGARLMFPSLGISHAEGPARH